MKTSKIIKAFAIAFAGYTMSEIHSKLNKIMSKQEQFDAALAKIDTATSEIASDLRTLRQQIQDGTVSEESLAKLSAAADTLEQMGKDPVEETPEEPGTGVGEGSEGDNGTGGVTEPDLGGGNVDDAIDTGDVQPASKRNSRR